MLPDSAGVVRPRACSDREPAECEFRLHPATCSDLISDTDSGGMSATCSDRFSARDSDPGPATLLVVEGGGPG